MDIAYAYAFVAATKIKLRMYIYTAKMHDINAETVSHSFHLVGGQKIE